MTAALEKIGTTQKGHPLLNEKSSLRPSQLLSTASKAVEESSSMIILAPCEVAIATSADTNVSAKTKLVVSCAPLLLAHIENVDAGMLA